jgi:hypothetical protein
MLSSSQGLRRVASFLACPGMTKWRDASANLQGLRFATDANYRRSLLAGLQLPISNVCD